MQTLNNSNHEKTGSQRQMGMQQVMSVHRGRHRPEPYSEGFDNYVVHSAAVAAAADSTILRSLRIERIRVGGGRRCQEVKTGRLCRRAEGHCPYWETPKETLWSRCHERFYCNILVTNVTCRVQTSHAY